MIVWYRPAWLLGTHCSEGDRPSSILMTGKGVDGFEPGKPAEVAVSRDDLGNAVFDAQGNDVGIVNQIACGTRLPKRLVEQGSVLFRFRQQKERRRSQQLFQVFQYDVQRNRRMEDARMSNNPEEFVDARPGDRPRQCAFGEVLEDLTCRNMVFARLDFSVDEDVRIDGLHRLTPIHEVEQGVPVKQVNSGQFRGFPAPQSQLVAPLGTGTQGATKKVIRHRLEGAAFFCGFPLQFAKKLVVDRQSGSCHMQKHTTSASRCQKAVVSG